MEHNADIVALCLLGLSAFWGAKRGFSREMFSLIAWVGAFVLAARTAPLLLPWLSQKLSDGLAATALAYVLSFIVLVLIFSMVAERFASGLRTVLIGGTDRLLGCFFGLARGGLILIVLYLLTVSITGEFTAHMLIAGSHSGPYILTGVHLLQELMPHLPQLHLALPPATGHEAAF